MANKQNFLKQTKWKRKKPLAISDEGFYILKI